MIITTVTLQCEERRNVKYFKTREVNINTWARPGTRAVRQHTDAMTHVNFSKEHSQVSTKTTNYFEDHKYFVAKCLRM